MGLGLWLGVVSMNRNLGRVARLAGACALMLAVAEPASATNLISVTYTGIASEILDPTGLFGAPRMNFSAAYVSTYLFDLDKGQHTSTPTYDQVYGGSAFGVESPLLESTLTIDGHTVHFGGGGGDQQFNQTHGFTESYASDFGLSGVWSYNFENIHFDAPYLLTSTFSALGSGEGAFHICQSQAGGCAPVPVILQGTLAPQTISVSAAVPEPGAWALMIAGFGLTGAVLRGRRRSLAI
jgi:hypothetical protein